MLIKGFRFGMLLQIAVGPICLFVFQTAVSSGILSALSAVIGVTIVDGLFIVAAILGLGKLIAYKPNLKIALQIFGFLVLILFGLSTFLGALDISLLPSLSFLPHQATESFFLKALFLTLSNPLTILFWAGVFSTKIVEDNLSQKQMLQFGTGAVMATLIFLSATSVAGYFVNTFLSEKLLTLFNLFIGLLLIGFGIKSGLGIFQKKTQPN